MDSRPWRTVAGSGLAILVPRATDWLASPDVDSAPADNWFVPTFDDAAWKSTPLALDANATRDQVMQAMNGHILGKAVLVGRFKRPQ